MKSLTRALALLVVALGVAPVLADSGGREQLRRGSTSRVDFDRDRLVAGKFVFNPSLPGQAYGISAQEYDAMRRGQDRVRGLMSRGLLTDQQLRDGIPTAVPPVPGLQPDELAVFARMGMTAGFSRAGTAHVAPNVHKDQYWVFDIDRILEPGNPETNPNNLPGVQVHAGEPTVYAVDVSIPVRPLKYERVFEANTEPGYNGGWFGAIPRQTVVGPHYRMPIEQWAMRADGTIAADPDTGALVPLQMVGPGDWFGWNTTSDPTLAQRYSYDPANKRFRVAMSLDPQDQSPNVFPAGGHIHCGFIYDFGNPLNCQKTARSGDPSTAESTKAPFGDTVIVSVDNRGRDN